MKTVSQLLAEKNHRIETIAPNMPVFDALKLMLEKDVGSLLVIEFGGLVGIFTERDYARKLVLQGKSSQNTLVRDVMSTKLITVKPEDTLDYCMQLVTEKRIRHLPVLDGGRLIGMLSIGDLLKAALAEQAATIAQLEAYINS
ncbi:MAG: CBS domain-containing protein [Burkholderiaceae bacterium]|nr:CBS domain-containing protein [Burkholderiaceae bacterium]